LKTKKQDYFVASLIYKNWCSR